MAIEKDTLSKSVIDLIKGKIISGELKPGERLPTVRKMMEEYQISSTPIREALKALEAMGLLEIKHGNGVFVSKQLPGFLNNKIQKLTLEDELNALHVLEVRRILELAVLKRVVKKISKANIELLAEKLLDMKNNQADLETFRQADLEFHLLITNSLKNPLLNQILQNVRELFKKQMTCDPLVGESLEDHKQIYEAIKEGNILKAQSAVEKHFNRMHDFYISETE